MKQRKGFTLIELLVTISIISLVMSVVTASVGKSRSKSRDAKRLSDIQQVQAALEIFFNEHSYYPVSTGCGATIPNTGWCNSVESYNVASHSWLKDNGVPGALSSSLKADPTDPSPKTPTTLNWNTGPGVYYYYSNTTPTFNGTYIIVFAVENSPNPLESNGGVTDCLTPTHYTRNYGTGSNGVITVGVSCSY